MATKEILGVQIDVTEEGYFNNPEQWTKEIAAEVAKEEGVEITDKHYEILEWIRMRFLNGDGLTIRGVGKSGVVDVKSFYQLFPGAPLKKATKIAGVPKPSSCI